MNIDKFDALLTDQSPYIAMVMTQEMEPVQGKNGVVFPPTYAEPQRLSREQQELWMGYDISTSENGLTKNCMLDSIGSQSNRMEEIFLSDEYSRLVPQVNITLTGKHETMAVNLLEVGHRSADALVRYSNLNEEINKAFNDTAKGNYTTLAKINPTALIFGAWDSRVTRVKIPRIVRAEIRAHDIEIHTQSATYMPPVDYTHAGIIDSSKLTPKIKKNMSGVGLNHVPASKSHGGITAKQIDRTVILNLAQIRVLNAENGDDTLSLRRYIFGLSLVAATTRNDSIFNLRQGCLLKESAPPKWEFKSSYYDTPNYDPFNDSDVSVHSMAVTYASKVAESFGVGENHSDVEFDSERALEEVEVYKESE